ncbi:hypothetical protein AMTR_s00066p00030840 [Amborella trichopoda]|uniref:Uncharacterized protein n=1 Tax=Amborella trichopoda TaxID=13333 RepID=U5DF70_AMBTC|nr:hypothetical protein AMTR_s00066p00030840 [Amborella trichopoda]
MEAAKGIIKEMEKEYYAPTRDDEDVEYEAQMEQARLASLVDIQERQMQIDGMFARHAKASSSRAPEVPPKL